METSTSSNQRSSYASASALASNKYTNEYVEISTQMVHDCRHLPDELRVVAAIEQSFGEDLDRKLMAPRRSNKGVWKIESPNIELYRSVKELTLNGEKVGIVSIRKETVEVTSDGKLKWTQQRNSNDLLVTLPNADKFPLDRIPDEDILKAVVEMDVGELKRAPQKQWDKEKKAFNGNKYFVLKDVLPADRNRIPEEFSFTVPGIGKLAIVLSHRLKMRYCGFCGHWHDAICETRQKYDQLKGEKAAMSTEKPFSVRICGDSTVRYFNEVAVEGAVEAMSGATTGNILNSFDVDDDFDDVQQIVLVSGSNDKKPTFTTEEYMYTLKVIRERVTKLCKEKKKDVAIVQPPKADILLSPEEIVKEEIFQQHLDELKGNGVKVWENPITYYEEDFGAHPSPDQSVTLCKFINEKVSSEFGVSVLMKSATDDVIALPNKYWHVTSFYKYGCGACDSKLKNTWYSICDICKEASQNDEVVKEKMKWYTARITEVTNEETPDLHISSGESEDELKCESCDITFHDMKELRQHCKERHPDNNGKFKRGRSKQPAGKTSTRRKQNAPLKSLDGSKK
jgi:uncharacterized C2H2 Zn-finger protein